jgi:hypothetical protein
VGADLLERLACAQQRNAPAWQDTFLNRGAGRVLPRQVSVEKLSPIGELSDEELALFEEFLASSRAKLVQKLEQHNGAASFPPASPDPAADTK